VQAERPHGVVFYAYPEASLPTRSDKRTFDQFCLFLVLPGGQPETALIKGPF